MSSLRSRLGLLLGFGLLLLPACGASVTAVGIEAEVEVPACAAEDAPLECASISNLVMPCRCNSHRYDHEAGRVSVWRERLDDDTTAVFSLDYLTSDVDVCGRDQVVGGEPEWVSSVSRDTLYGVEGAGELVHWEGAPLAEEEPDLLTFTYEVDGISVTENHAVAFREEMRLDPYMGMPCCSVGPGAGGWAVLPVLLLAAASGLRRRERDA